MSINRLKLSLLVWLAVYPLVTALTLVTSDAVPDAPLLLRTLLTTLVMVPAMTFVIIPSILRAFGPWLTPKPEPRDPEYERRLDEWFEEMASCPN